jgi:hypothetical protein
MERELWFGKLSGRLTADIGRSQDKIINSKKYISLKTDERLML